ncbi:MAG: DUF484 family protein [Dongiaceae bacterium]
MRKTPEDARQVMTAERVKSRVTAAQVADYLRRHPDFLAHHPDLLDGQVAPARKRGDGVVDLQQFMVERLRRDIARLRADQDDLLANSRDNQSTTERIHRAALALLGAESFEHLIETVTTDLAVFLDVDAVALCIEAADDKTPTTMVEGVQLLTPGAVDRILGFDRNALLRDDVAGDPIVFGGSAGLVRSDALIRLTISEKTPSGLLAFGTRHPGYFNPGQGTDLLNFLAHLLEHCIRTWLNLPGRTAS